MVWPFFGSPRQPSDQSSAIAWRCSAVSPSTSSRRRRSCSTNPAAWSTGPAASHVTTLRETLATAERRDLYPGELANAGRAFQDLIKAVSGAWIAARARVPGNPPRAVAPLRPASPDAKRPPE